MSVAGDGERVVGRVLLIDALRGVAALAVLLFHLLRNSPQTDVLVEAVPGAFRSLSDYGRNGVAVFFVISGFAIASSIRALGSRASDGARYSARRQVRLDPPYYVMIAVAVVVGIAQTFVPSLVGARFSPFEILANMLYLQDILGVTPILAVAWSLCLEVQFYLFVVVLVLLSGRLVRSLVPSSRRQTLIQVGALATGLVSLSLPFLGIDAGPWFIGLYWMFALGMVVCWFAVGSMSAALAIGALSTTTVWCVMLQLGWAAQEADPWLGEWFAVATAWLVFAVAATGRLGWRPPRWLLWFGGISYSLYLVHLPVIDVVMGAMNKVLGSGRPAAFAAYAVGAVLSVLAAVVLRRLVEQPAIGWSRRVGLPVRRPAAAQADE